ncbi:carbon-nitrogen hydrolase family protein [Chryseobacterium proteolyticum]|uniref:carbon-nitrogen hydrolase family protein n=1 Tax=Chryseobacterium proteolyticum TaxID=118127 RepID=UPI003983376D
MKVTVCELSNDRKEFLKDWRTLQDHLVHNKTDLLLLPEMPFYSWFAINKEVSQDIQQKSVEQHQLWIKEVEKLEAKYIVYSAPEIVDTKFYNTAFVFQRGKGHRRIHTKSLFPEEDHFWEESWFDREDNISFETVQLDELKIGVLMCTELWFTEYARRYGKQNADILLCPRATGKSSVEQWLTCGKASAIISGTYCLSSNRSGKNDEFEWGGTGWIIEPVTGNVLEYTAPDRKFVTYSIDLKRSVEAKKEYPLNVNGF